PSWASKASNRANGCSSMPARSSCTSCNPPCARTTTSKSSGLLRFGVAKNHPFRPRRKSAHAGHAYAASFFPRLFAFESPRMKLRIVALGHKLPRWVCEGYDDYARRLPREFSLELVELKPEPRSRGKSAGQI